MLIQRVITAAVLLILVITCLSFSNPWPMLGLICIMIACTTWEWLRLVQDKDAFLKGLITVFALIYCVYLLLENNLAVNQIFEFVLLPLSIVFWLLFAPPIIKNAAIPNYFNARVLSALGILLLFTTWYALAWFYLEFGAIAFITMWALVWCADIAAYFTGKLFGKHKLAPKVSPGKTWEGAFGGLIAAILWLVLTAIYLPDSFGYLLQLKFDWIGLVIIGLVLASWSIIGDLFESMLKRRAGVKDSSNLLPGHGGVYDRIDAVLPVAPMAAILFIF